MVDNKMTKIGSGGRLYRDSRPAEKPEVSEEPVKEGKRPPWAAASYENLDPDSPKPEPEQRMPWTVKPMVEPKPKPGRDWRQFHSTLLEVAGMGALSGGFAMLYQWLGLVVLGVCLIVLGVAAGLPQKEGPAE